MSEEIVTDDEQIDDADEARVNEADLQGFLLKIAVGGITVQDYVKRLEENDILIAIDGKPYLDGPQRLRDTFLQQHDVEEKWLLSFYRNGVVFDILIDHPIQSAFGYATENETDFVLEAFKKHTFGDFQPMKTMRFIGTEKGNVIF